MSVVDSDISQSAVALSNGRIWSLPAPSIAAIFVGTSSTVKGNRVSDTVYFGIWAVGSKGMGNGIVESNAVKNCCLQLNDCGAIYTNWDATNTRIASNFIAGVRGNTTGLGSTVRSLAVGIYLDEHSNGITVENNTVTGADYGILLHDAYSNVVTKNTLFGNRRYQLYMQEDNNSVRANGDVYDNRIEENLMVPDLPGISVMKKSNIGQTTAFASFARNHYSALLSSRIVGDLPVSGPYAEMRFEEWQSMPAATGSSPDSTSTITYPVGYAASKIASGNIVPNGKLTLGSLGWSSWNPATPYGQLKAQTCTAVGPCLQYSGGGSDGIISSPNFSVTGGIWYRVTFDAKTGETGQPFDVIVRRDGNGTNVGYEALMPRAEAFTGNAGWKRYSFSFKATKTITANDPVTRERGARVDFGSPAGKIIIIANLEMVATIALEIGVNLRMVNNSGRDTADLYCPEGDNGSKVCVNYVRMSDLTPVSWPLRLLPLESEIIFTRDPALVDSDADGIADSQDACPRTLPGEVTNSSGCALTQGAA